jgi:hypothetical protein
LFGEAGDVAFHRRLGDIGIRPVERDTWLPAGDRVHPSALVGGVPETRPSGTALLRGPVVRDRHVGGWSTSRPNALESSGRDADDRVDDGADPDRAADDVRAAAELRAPHRIGEHCHSGPGGSGVFRGGEVSADNRRSVEEVEERVAHEPDEHLTRIIALADGEPPRGVAGEAGEGCRPAFEILERHVPAYAVDEFLFPVGVGDVYAVRRGRVAEHRRRPEEQLIDDVEHRGVAADAEGERRDHGDGERGLGSEAAKGVGEILAEVVGAHVGETPSQSDPFEALGTSFLVHTRAEE